jgi:predicted dehydrogenase
LLGGHFKRIISDPAWLPDFFDPLRVGGPMVDLHIHDAHFIRLLAGMPTSVFTSGRMRGDVAEYFTSHFQFADPTVTVTATGGVIRQQGRSFTHAYELHLERATLLYDFSVIGDQPVTGMPVTVLTATGKILRPKIRMIDSVASFSKELAEAARAITSGEPSPLLRGELAGDALRICQAETASLAGGKPVKIA